MKLHVHHPDALSVIAAVIFAFGAYCALAGLVRAVMGL